MSINNLSELILKLNFDLNDEDINALRSLEERLCLCGVSREDIETVLTLRMEELEVFVECRRSYRGEFACNETLYILQETDIFSDYGVSTTVFIDETKENYLRLIFNFNDNDILNVRNFEEKLKDAGFLSDDDIIKLLNMRVQNINRLKDNRYENNRFLTAKETGFLRGRYPALFDNNFIDEAVFSEDDFN